MLLNLILTDQYTVINATTVDRRLTNDKTGNKLFEFEKPYDPCGVFGPTVPQITMLSVCIRMNKKK